MASPLKSARDTMVTVVEALTPPTDAAVTYHLVDGRSKLDGVSGRRAFYFEPPRGGVVKEFGALVSTLRHEVQLVLRLSTAGLSRTTSFNDVADETVLVTNAINNRSSWPSGVDYVQVEGYETRDTDSDDIEVVFAITVETQETD